MSTDQKVIDQCIALAAMAQAVRAVQQIAWKGDTNQTDLRAVIASLLQIDASSAAAIYGGSFEVSSGLRMLSQQIDPQHHNKDPEFVNLVINVMSLQGKLEKNRQLMQTLGSEIDRLSAQYRDSDFQSNPETFDNLLTDCSQVYQKTLSKMPDRIQVKGEPRHLKESNNQNSVRAALLAAIRASFLWRQSGGSRWHFLFKKKLLIEGIRSLLANPIKE